MRVAAATLKVPCVVHLSSSLSYVRKHCFRVCIKRHWGPLVLPEIQSVRVAAARLKVPSLFEVSAMLSSFVCVYVPSDGA